MAVFGAILSLANIVGTLVFLFLLIFLVLLEASVSFVERLCNRFGFMEIFDKLKKELMILGIISFIVFIFESAADQSSSKLHQWFLGFEIAHIIILFMALSFIVQAIIMVQYASSEGRKLVVAVRKTSDELIQEYKKLEEPKAHLYQRLQRYTFFHLASWVPLYPSFRDHIEYKIIERFFLRQHKLPREFKFSKYANSLFKNYISELGNIPSLGWFVLALAVVVNYIRIALIDESSQDHYCSSSESSSHRRYLTEDSKLDVAYFLNLFFSLLFDSFKNPDASSSEGLSRILASKGGSKSESIGASIEKSCLQYIFVYAFTCLSMLTFVIFITYLMSSIYLERLLEVCMNRDSISMKEDGRKAYLEYLEMMRSTERKRHERTQKSIVEFTPIGDNDSILYDDIFDRDHSDIEAHDSPQHSPHPMRQSSYSQRSSMSIDDSEGGRQSYGRKSSTRHLSFSLDDFNHEREINVHKKEHLDEIIHQLPWYRQLLFHVYRLWLGITKCCTIDSEDASGRRSSLTGSDADLSPNPGSAKLDRKISPSGAEAITRSRRSSGIRRSESVSKRVFLFGSSRLYYRIVELGLLFQCFYISIWATQLMPLAQRSDHKDYWIPAFTIPIVLNIILVGMTLHRSVMLKAAIELSPDIVGTVVEECIQERSVIKDLQGRVREKLSESNTPRRLWKVFVRDQFLEFDVNNDGSLDQLEFREFLGSLDIFMGKRHFDILWEAIDIDLSGAVTWDELFVIVFPEFKYDIREELKVVETIQQHFKQYFQLNKIPKLKYLSTIQEIFSKYDTKGINSLTKSELWNLLKDLGVQGISKKMYQLLILSMDYSGEGNDIKFTEFVRVIFGSELAVIAGCDYGNNNHHDIARGSSIRFTSMTGEIKTRRRSNGYEDDLSSFVPFSGIIHPDAAVDSNADPSLPRLNPVVGGYKRVSTFEMVEMVKKNKEMIITRRPSQRQSKIIDVRAVDTSPSDTEKTIVGISPIASSSFTPRVQDEVKENKSSPSNMLFESVDETLPDETVAQEPIGVDEVSLDPIDESQLTEVELRKHSLVLDDSGPALAALMETMRSESVRGRRFSIDI